MGATSVVIDQMVSAMVRLTGAEYIDEECLAAGDHGSGDRALQHAKSDQRGQAPGEPAQQRGQGEEHHRDDRRCAPRRSAA